MSADHRRSRLGRGLASLIGSASEPPPEGEYRPVTAAPDTGPLVARAPLAVREGPRLESIGISSIRPNPHQPRRNFDPERLRQLADSLNAQGMLQPVLVCPIREDPASGGYRLIAGERRLRAAELAGLSQIPCIVRDATDEQTLELALIENLHRDDLNPIERARGYRDLMDRFGLTQEQAAERVCQARATVANHLRMLDLCDSVQQLVVDGALSFGHARALAALAGSPARQAELAERCVREGMSVRRLEEAVRAIREGGQEGQKQGQSPAGRSPYIADLESQLTRAIGTKVCVRPGRGRHRGRIVIEYYSLDDFDRIVAALGAKIES